MTARASSSRCRPRRPSRASPRPSKPRRRSRPSDARPDKDELELVRAHVPRGEAVTWSARVDPKAFPRVVSPGAPSADRRRSRRRGAAAEPRAARPARVCARRARRRARVRAAREAGLGRACMRSASVARGRCCPSAGASARSRMAPRPQARSRRCCGGRLPTAPPSWSSRWPCAAHRSPAPIARAAGPGRWQPIADADVLVARAPAPASGDALDIGTRPGKVTALALVLVLALLTFVLRTRVAGAAIAIPLTGAALVPLFTTGTRAQLPRAPAELAARILAPARDMLARLVDLAHVDVRCMARFCDGTRTYDEVRLACAPSDRIPGLRTIELALAGALARGARCAARGARPLRRRLGRGARRSRSSRPASASSPVAVRGEGASPLAARADAVGGARLLARLAADLEDGARPIA